jgi:hypothetical protein
MIGAISANRRRTAPSLGAHRYWRMVFRETGNGTTGFLGLAEVELFEDYFGANIAPLATVTTDCTTLSNQGPTKAKDAGASVGSATWLGSLTDMVFGASTWVNKYLKFDFGSGNDKEITVHRVIGSALAATLDQPKKWDWQYSDDDTNWTTVETIDGQTGWDDFEIRTFAAPGVSAPSYSGSPWGTHTYWRILLINVAQPNFAFGCREVELRATPGGADQATGGTATAGNSFSGSFLPANAFDDSTATAWASASWSGASAISTNFLRYQFGSAVAVAGVLWNARAGSTEGRQSPSTSWVQFSDDGTNWTTAWRIRDASNWSDGETRTYSDPLYV